MIVVDFNRSHGGGGDKMRVLSLGDRCSLFLRARHQRSPLSCVPVWVSFAGLRRLEEWLRLRQLLLQLLLGRISILRTLEQVELLLFIVAAASIAAAKLKLSGRRRRIVLAAIVLLFGGAGMGDSRGHFCPESFKPRLLLQVSMLLVRFRGLE